MLTHLRREIVIGTGACSEQLLDRLRRNDPALKELTLFLFPAGRNSVLMQEVILPAFDAIATSTSLEILNITGSIVMFLRDADTNDRVTRALGLNTSLKDIRITTYHSRLKGVLDIVMASPNLEDLTIRYRDVDESAFNNRATNRSIIDNITAAAQVLRQDTKLHSLTIQGFGMGSDMGATLATAFYGNQTIKKLIMRGYAISMAGAVSFVEALPHDHSLEVIVFDEGCFGDDSAVSIISALCHTPLKVLLLAGSRISQEGSERIVQILGEYEHSFTKVELFRNPQDSPWQNKIRLQIGMLTWENRLQLEKDTWVAQFLQQDAHTQELLFRTALERANKVDNEPFPNPPNMLFYLIKELPDLIAQAVRDGALNVNCHGTRQLVYLCCCILNGKEL